MYRTRSFHSYAHRILCLILVVFLYGLTNITVFADQADPIALDRYDNLENKISPGGTVAPDVDGDLEAVEKTKEEIELEEFNGVFVDTVIYIIGGVAGMMMILQITAFAVCKLYPSWNHIVAKLSKIGITGYEDGWLAPTIKILLLGVLAYLCISGTMKVLVAYILGWFTNFVHFE